MWKFLCVDNSKTGGKLRSWQMQPPTTVPIAILVPLGLFYRRKKSLEAVFICSRVNFYMFGEMRRRVVNSSSNNPARILTRINKCLLLSIFFCLFGSRRSFWHCKWKLRISSDLHGSRLQLTCLALLTPSLIKFQQCFLSKLDFFSHILHNQQINVYFLYLICCYTSCGSKRVVKTSFPKCVKVYYLKGVLNNTKDTIGRQKPFCSK